MTFALRIQGYQERSAEIDGSYRYRLARAWAPGGRRALVCMANPSTADEMRDDQTIRRLTQLLADAGYSGFTVVNLFAWRATDPRELGTITAAKAIGPRNDETIAAEIVRHPAAIVAWGAPVAGRQIVFDARARWFIQLALRNGCQLYCLGRTKDGHPRHPSRLPRSARLEAWG